MEFWKFLAGLGLFLYGINLTEHVLKKVSGRSFKLFLKQYTQNLTKSIFAGTVLTALLQSSSVVSLLVLAFVGAGIITFRNALGVILGSNVGTTLSSWIVASVGFKLDIETYSLPVIAITATAMFFIQRQKKIHNLLRLFFAIGILFLGLAYMKTGAEGLVAYFDFTSFAQYPLIFFVLIGFIVTSVIQSSSAMVAITLTALHTHAVTFYGAAAIVIGAELGTSVKLVLAALRGSADKKRVAWGNFIFNAATLIIAFLFLSILIPFIQKFVGIHDPLIGLVFFQTLINMLTILLFVPVINPFSRWLEGKFKTQNHYETTFISRDFPTVSELVADALYQEVNLLITKTVTFHRLMLNLDNGERSFLQSLKTDNSSDESYERLKKTEGEILQYVTRLLPDELNRDHYAAVRQYIDGVRHTIHSAKSMKDIQHDLKELVSSGNDTLHGLYLNAQADWIAFDTSFKNLHAASEQKILFEGLTLAMKVAFQAQQRQHVAIVEGLKKKQLTELETSTMMNVQREILSSKKSLLRALAHLKLSAEEADAFEFLPAY
jgi:phosphate:Na+ symporter